MCFSEAKFKSKFPAYSNCQLLAGGSGLHPLTLETSGQSASHQQQSSSGNGMCSVNGIKDTCKERGEKLDGGLKQMVPYSVHVSVACREVNTNSTVRRRGKTRSGLLL